MAVEQTKLVWELALPHNKLVVLLALADHAHPDGSHVYPSIEYTAWKTGYRRRQVQRILSALREDGLIEVVAFKLGGVYPTIYQLRLDRGVKKTPLQNDPVSSEVVQAMQDAARRVPSGGPGGGVTVMTPESSVTIIEPPEEPLTRALWLGTLRGIDGWKLKGEPYVDNLQAWVLRKEWTTEQLEASALGLASCSDKTLKGYRDMAAAFQRRLNQGYDDPRRHADNGRRTGQVPATPGSTGRSAGGGWDNRGT